MRRTRHDCGRPRADRARRRRRSRRTGRRRRRRARRTSRARKPCARLRASARAGGRGSRASWPSRPRDGQPLQPQPLPDRRRERRLVQRVEVQARRAARDQLRAQVGHDVEPERADRRDVVAVAFEAAPDPARDLGAAGVREAPELRCARDRHDARHDRDAHAHRVAVVDEPEVRVRVEEVLRDRRVRAGVDLALEVREVGLRRAGLRVHLGVGGHVDVEPVAGHLADERDQLVRMAELAGVERSRRHVAAQRDEMADAVRAVLREDLREVRARRADARDVRGRGHALGADLEHRLERAFARRAARAERDRAERRLELRELPARRAQLLDAVGRARRKELEAVGAAGRRNLPGARPRRVVAHRCGSGRGAGSTIAAIAHVIRL